MFGGMSCPLHRFYRMHIELSCSHSADGFSSNATRQQPESRSMSRTISVGWPDSLELEARTRGARNTHDLHLPGRHWHDPRSFPEGPRPSKMPRTTSLHRNLMKWLRGPAPTNLVRSFREAPRRPPSRPCTTSRLMCSRSSSLKTLIFHLCILWCQR